MTTPIPSGYLQDSRGRLVPESQIKPHELHRDQLVRDLIDRALQAQAQLAEVKRDMLGDVEAHLQLVAEQYDVTLSGSGANVTLSSYDGLFKIERDVSDRLEIGEEIQAAEELIRQILDEIQDPTAKAIVDRAFRRHRKTGELSPSKLIDLAAVQLDDPRWLRAQQAIRDAIRATSTVTYFRAYRRETSDSPWQQIALDFSSIQPAPKETQA